MKNRIISPFATLVAATLVAAVEPTPPPCCPPLVVAPACCAVEKPLTPPAVSLSNPPAASLSNRSLYQLNATWTNDTGAIVQLASLRGKPVVVAMFFAQCEYACPVLVQDMQRVRAALPDALREKTQLVLVSFDTERDTPSALKTYRERAALDAGWTLLRGDTNAVQELAMLLGVKFKRDARGQFAHSNLITILNAEGEIVHQKSGLMGDVSEMAKVLAAATK